MILVLSLTVLHDEQLAQYRAVVPPDASITAEEVLKRAQLLIILNMLTLGVVPGTLLGVGFAIIYDRLPGKSSRAKGMALMSLIWR